MRKIYIPLFWKFVIAIFVIVTIFASINAYLIWTDVQQSLEKESEKRALVIANNLKHQLVTPLLFEDYVTAQKLLDEFMLFDSSLRYAFIKKENELLLHTFQNQIPTELLNIKYDTDGEYTVTLISNYNVDGIIRDIGMPILEPKLGVLRIGISEDSIFYDVRNTVFRFWLMVGFFLVCGIGGAFLFAHFITKPLKAIKEATEELTMDSLKQQKSPMIYKNGYGRRNAKILFAAHDEIDRLTENFSKMILRLQTTYYELRQTQTKLIESEKLATIGTMASGIAHEINNPISGIQNAIRRIIKSPNNIEQNSKYLSMMLRASERIEKVVKELLNFSRREEISQEWFDIIDLLKRIELLLSHKINKLGIELLIFIDENNRSIFASRNHIEQVLINLILNSTDAIEQSKETAGRIVIKVENSPSYFVISVEDNGCGINLTEKNKIFDPFYTTKEINKGTGLGLAIIKQIIDFHNGNIDIESDSKKGTRFIVKLPRKMNKKSA